MAINRGKEFENRLRQQFEKLPDTFVLRLYDVTMGYKNIDNPCDLMVYRNGTLNLFELKAIHGNTLNFKSHIRENQWNSLVKYDLYPGINAGIIVWFIDLDKTFFIPGYDLQYAREVMCKKSFNATSDSNNVYEILGKKKRTFFDYDLDTFLKEIEYGE